MFGLTCRVGAHISRYAHDTRLYPIINGSLILEIGPIKCPIENRLCRNGKQIAETSGQYTRNNVVIL